MKNKLLRNGVEMPEVGFGTWKAGETDGFAVLSEAIRAGYRHIDTASAYHTEEAVGRAVAASGVDRSEFFITTKAWKDQLGYDRTLAAFDASCQALGMDYLDLYLIHWPRPDAACEEWKELDRGSWRAMEELYRAGRVRAIGVSNFLPHHLENLLEVCTVPPMVDQIEFHPGYVQWETVEFCRASQILVEAWSPWAARGWRMIPCWRSWPENTGSPRPRSACASPWTAAWFPCPSRPTLDGCARTWRWTLPWRRRTWSGCGPCPRQAGPACTRTSEPAGQKRARPPPRMRGGRAFPYLFVRLVLGADLQHKVPEPLDRGQDPAVLGAEHIEHAVGLSVRDVEGTDRVEPEAEHAGHDAHP